MGVRKVLTTAAVLVLLSLNARAEGFLACRGEPQTGETVDLPRFFDNFVHHLSLQEFKLHGVQLLLSGSTGRAAHIRERTVVVQRGLGELLQNSSEAAFVVAHELSHILLEHGSTYRRQVAQEFEADALALRLMARAGCGETGGPELLERLDRKGEGSPLTSLRIAAMKAAGPGTESAQKPKGTV